MSIYSEIERITNSKENIKQAMLKRGVDAGEARLHKYPYFINLIGNKKYEGSLTDITMSPEILRLQESKSKMIEVLMAKGVDISEYASLEDIALAIGKI